MYVYIYEFKYDQSRVRIFVCYIAKYLSLYQLLSTYHIKNKRHGTWDSLSFVCGDRANRLNLLMFGFQTMESDSLYLSLPPTFAFSNVNTNELTTASKKKKCTITNLYEEYFTCKLLEYMQSSRM